MKISDKQREDWQKLVDYLRQFGNGACLNTLLVDGPDNTTNFARLLKTFQEQDRVSENS